MTGEGVTVAVATLGRPEGLARCLQALAAQTQPVRAVIVVDQGRAEEARAVVEAAELPATYLPQEQLGLSASRNLALSRTDDGVLAVTDDDCVPDPGWVAAIGAAFGRKPRPGAVSGPVLALGEGSPGTYAISLRDSEAAVDHSGKVLPWEVGSGGNFAAPVELLEELGGWDERLGAGSPGQAAEDSDLALRLLLRGCTVRYDPAVVVRHDWQTRERRMATRWSYGYGIGALCGLRLAAGDAYALRMLAGYARLHLRPLAGAVRRRERSRIAERSRALAAPLPGLLYGLRVGP